MRLPDPVTRYLVCCGGDGNRHYQQFASLPKAYRREVPSEKDANQLVDVVEVIERPEFVYCGRGPERILGLRRQPIGTVVELEWRVTRLCPLELLPTWGFSG